MRFLAFLNRFFISESIAHTVMFFYFTFHIFLESTDIVTFPLKAAKIYVEKSVHKKKVFILQWENKSLFLQQLKMLERVWVQPWRAWEAMPVVNRHPNTPKEAENTRTLSPSMPRACLHALLFLCFGKQRREQHPGKKSRCLSSWSLIGAEAPLSSRQDTSALIRIWTRKYPLRRWHLGHLAPFSHNRHQEEKEAHERKTSPQLSRALQSSPCTQTSAPAPSLTFPCAKQGCALSQFFFWVGVFGASSTADTETLQAEHTLH